MTELYTHRFSDHREEHGLGARTTVSARAVALAERVADVIEANPTAFWMGTWRSDVLVPDGEDLLSYDERPGCGTTLCIAGWTATLDPRVEWVIPLDDPAATESESVLRLYVDDLDDNERDSLHDLREIHGRPTAVVADVARVLLGISEAEAGHLFYGGTAATRVRHLLQDAQGRA